MKHNSFLLLKFKNRSEGKLYHRSRKATKDECNINVNITFGMTERNKLYVYRNYYRCSTLITYRFHIFLKHIKSFSSNFKGKYDLTLCKFCNKCHNLRIILFDWSGISYISLSKSTILKLLQNARPIYYFTIFYNIQ